MKRIILITTFSLLACLLTFAEGRYVYTQISQPEGLTSTVNTVCKEKDGQVWIGTPNGLYSFNGYSLKHYREHLPGCRRVFHLDIDHNGSLWVLTDKHVFRRDAEKDVFEKFSNSEDLFFCMTGGSEVKWFGGLNKIYRYSYGDGSFEHIFDLHDGFECRSICMLNDSTLLCCSHKGKILVNTETGEISDAKFGAIQQVYAALVDSKGRVWFALYNNGVQVYTKEGKLLREYNTSNSALSNNLVLCLEEREGHILAGTDGGGINIIDLENDRIHIVSHVSGDSSSFPAHSIKSLYVDDYGTLWAGSIRDGLINISLSDINSYHDTYLGLSDGLSNSTVLCLYQSDGCDEIWIGTDGDGINRYNPQTARFTHYESTFKKKIVSIADFSAGKLVISSYADNVWIFDKKTGLKSPLPFSDGSLRRWISHSGRSINLYNELDGDLLLFSNVVYRYDKTDGRCIPIDSHDGKRSYSNYFILGRNSDGVWFHNNNNICLLADDSDSLMLKGVHANGVIRSGHLASGGVIWLATDEGLCNFNVETGKFGHITTTLFSDANSVVCDNHSRVWVGTEKGLSAYLIDSESFTLFGESDGVAPNEYLSKPHMLAENGDVYLGGVQGLLHIGDGYRIDKTADPVLKLSGLSFDGNAVEENGSVVYKAPRDSKNMQIEISVQEKDMFRHRVFRFNFSDKKVFETSVPVLSLRQKPRPGVYHVTVSCTLKNGEWSEPFALMTLKVPQPWYLSWWFILGCVLFVTGMYALAIYTINKRKANQLKIAMQEQEQKVYEEKVQMLINVSHELRTPLTLIMAPIKRLLKVIDPGDENYNTMGRIYRQSRRMQNLLDMVLDLRKMEVGGNRLRKERSEFNAWIAASVDDIVNEEKAEGINIVFDFDPSVGVADFDHQKCDIVLMNVLINAIKHSSAGDTITISTRRTEDGMIRTSISDQGPGLASDIDPIKMFSRFYQSNSEKYGSGIGLSYSKILVELHGGNISVFNNPDKGATFWWDLPVKSEETPSEAAPRAYLNELLGHSSEADVIAPADDDFSTGGMRLMIVDDNTDLLDFIREALCQDFAEIITVTGGNPAMRELSSGRLPDIIVSDVNMPDGDGFKLCSDIKNNDKYSHIPVILLTARGEDQSQSESYRLGADGFLAKPFDIETLMELVRSLLRSKAQIRRRYLDEDLAPEDAYGSNEERFIIQLNRIIAEHISDPDLDQQLICMELGVSRALLYNRMKAITGAGTKEYITKIRIEKAKSLIESTSLTIAEVSDMTGFASQSYFSTAFKNYTGMTPSQYKAANKKD